MSDVAGRLRELAAADAALILDALADCEHPAGADTCAFCEAVFALNRMTARARGYADALDALAAMTTCKGPWNGTTEDGGDPAACPRCVSAGSAVLADAGRLLGDNT